MRGSSTIYLLLFFTFLAFLACGDEAAEEETGTDNPTIVIGSGNIFATTELAVPAASTVVVVNQDGDPHTITSESALGAFDNSGDFDLVVGSDSNGLLTVPDLPSGTVLFFYCRFHEGSMTPADGTILIE